MNKKIKLGIFFVFTVAIFIFSIFMFGKIRMTRDGYRVHIDYIFIGDLRVNGKVAYRGGGIVIGFIESILVNPDGTIRATAFITDRKVTIPDGTRFTIQTVGFGLGEKYIMATPPMLDTSGQRSIADGTVVKGIDPVTIENTIESFSDLSGQVDLQDISKFINDISKTVVLINDLLENNNEDITKAISDARATLHNFNIMSDRLNKMLVEIDRGEGSLGAVVKDKKLYSDLQIAAQNLKEFSTKIKENPSSLLFTEVKPK